MDYSFLLNTRTSERWHKIGVQRRAGICIPLFSVYSENSTCIGEIPDLKYIIDWCTKTGMTVLQLLPLNDVGNDFAPYSSVSTFALDPMYISINLLKEINTEYYTGRLMEIKKHYHPLFGRINYKIKNAKLRLLWDIFIQNPPDGNNAFKNFITNNYYWIREYALYKILTESLPDDRWEMWNDSLKSLNFDTLNEIESINSERINFYYWLQWQLFEQMKEVKQYASSKGIFLMGDLPFLVSRESSDVWSHQNYFHMNLSAGAPPDMYFALGQKWGMPPYNWDNIANDGFVYIREKLKYAENFYDMFRIDHFVGLFRVWISNINDNSPTGRYMPIEEHLWEMHGRRILDEMLNSTSMLPCAEDLGTVPECSYRVLQDYGIPGVDFQRYMKSNFSFRNPFDYRQNSCSVVSTHDSAFFINWWHFEAGTIDERLFELMYFSQGNNKERFNNVKEKLFNLQKSKNGRLLWNENINSAEVMLSILQPLGKKADEFTYLYLESYDEKLKFLNFLGLNNTNGISAAELTFLALKKANEANSIFSLQLLHEYLCLDTDLVNKISRNNYRINIPGKVSRNNWSVILPLSIEKLNELDINSQIYSLVSASGRI